MPYAAKTPCRHTGCHALVSQPGFCETHRKQRQAEQDQQRGSAAERGYGYRWQKTSKAYLKAHPLCECPDCKAGELRVTVAEVVDHIVPHRGDMALFWKRANWQAMSKQCHDKKTAREDGGFGRGGGGQKSAAF